MAKFNIATLGACWITSAVSTAVTIQQHIATDGIGYALGAAGFWCVHLLMTLLLADEVVLANRPVNK